MEVLMPRTEEAFQQIRDESRRNILDEAAKVFAAKGVANTKISDLAEAAGISQGLLYRYFIDKDDVFIALLERAVNGINDIAQTCIGHTGTSLQKLHWLTEQILQGMSQEPVYLPLISQAMALSGKAHETIWKLETVVTILRELIVEGQTVGEIAKRDPDQLVILYLGCLYGLAAGKGFSIPWLDEHIPTTDTVLQILKP
jgi:AcrR family transcriptional regulator